MLDRWNVTEMKQHKSKMPFESDDRYGNESDDLSNDAIKEIIFVLSVLVVIILLFIFILLLCRVLCHRRLSIRCVKIRQTEEVESINYASQRINTISSGRFYQGSNIINSSQFHPSPIPTSSMVVPYGSPIVENPAYVEDEVCGYAETDDNNADFTTALSLTRCDFELEEFDPNMAISKTIKVESKLVVYMCRMIGSEGGFLELANMGISLFVPPGAIPVGKQEKIFLILDWDLSDFPSMTDSQTIISPVVHCGPHGLALNKPAVLKYKHCAYDKNDIEVFASETNLMHTKQWMKVSEDKEKRYDLTGDECKIYITHFTLYTSIAHGSNTRKWIQIVAFAGPIRVGCHFQVRLYFLNNTPCALQFAKQNEEKQNFHQVGPEQVFLFNGNEEDMMVYMSHKSEGWSCANELKERISYLSIWHGKCPHLSFIFKHENVNVPDISLCLKTYQKGREDEFMNFKILLSLPQPTVNDETWLKPGFAMSVPHERRDSNGYHSQGGSPKTIRQASEHSTTNIYISPSSMDNVSMCTSPCTFEVIPYQLQMDLVKLLDPPCLFGNDWRIIASALDMDATIPLLKNQSSPTTILLQSLMQQDRTMDWLAEILLKNDRLDAANVIMKVCKEQQSLEEGN